MTLVATGLRGWRRGGGEGEGGELKLDACVGGGGGAGGEVSD